MEFIKHKTKLIDMECVPKGYHAIQAFASDDGDTVVVPVIPGEKDPHNCDWEACGSLDHVVRFSIKEKYEKATDIPEKKFVKFRENNDSEGESWNFWLQVDGNEKALEVLKSKISGESNYDLTDKILNEREVNLLMENAGGNYMSSENKVPGTLDAEKIVVTETKDTLYKGGIRKMFTGKEGD